MNFIWFTFEKEGIHMYHDAAVNPKLATGEWDDVRFLANPHRHIFHFKVFIQVFHGDRDVEFIQAKRYCERLYNQETLNLNHRSCEMIAQELYPKIVERYPGRKIIIEVSEDGENGCRMEY